MDAGYIAEGFKRFGCKENLNEEPLHHLLNVYVRIHQQSQTDPSIHQDAMNFFKRLEEGDAEARKFWRMCRDVSFSEYQSMYKKLDVNFDVTHCESMYSKECGSIIEELKSKNFLLFRDGVGYVDLSTAGDHRQQNMHAPLLKSDGSSLYLTRDLASAQHRRKEFQAHKLYYVVENGQQQHFKLLSRCLEKCFDVRLNEDMHVKFGRVEGMSTRKGSAVFLSDLIRHARSTVKERMQARSTTKVTVEEDVDAVADALAVCGVVVFDLKQSRMNNYKFDWDEALNFNGDTGIFLQYTHARLNSSLLLNIQLFKAEI
ncbi:hypothetical protein HELRODRAFT_194480 [Helobdella robusta]|uniref:Probable arginine--tRNA ligase, mitochondrial n=1 Tax=Helobdella robusta TaxID=6412 RepID=T1FW38_HELRO|nr:hypothetical protein HELRODRAFT_194480 [Helobdella robusta]ESN91891.1 hypothetical protein HELRODRAFT_194480 [Helobdella robusta]